MKFIINRASMWNNERPCKEAVPETVSYTFFGNSREETVWVVLIDNLKELLKFEEKYGSLIVDKKYFGACDKEKVWYDTITIYDDYLE